MKASFRKKTYVSNTSSTRAVNLCLTVNLFHALSMEATLDAIGNPVSAVTTGKALVRWWAAEDLES